MVPGQTAGNRPGILVESAGDNGPAFGGGAAILPGPWAIGLSQFFAGHPSRRQLGHGKRGLSGSLSQPEVAVISLRAFKATGRPQGEMSNRSLKGTAR